MKILFIGDIVGRLGRDTVKEKLPSIQKKYKPDLIVANAENLAHGKGITEKTVLEMHEAGIDFFTSGNHINSNIRGAEYLENNNIALIRPANMKDGIAGSGFGMIEVEDIKILIVNLLGQVFIEKDCSSPFNAIDDILKKNKKAKPNIILIDFHAEATSEKQGLWHYVDGRVAAVIGTHTHVATANPRISQNGTALCEDAGMVGGSDSVIGADKNIILERFLTGEKKGFEPTEQGPSIFNSLLLNIDEKTGKTKTIKRIDLI